MPQADTAADNARFIDRELDWLSAAIEARLALHFAAPGASADRLDPPVAEGEGGYAAMVRQYRLGADERLILALAAAPLLAPQRLDPLLMRDQNLDRGFTIFGGVTGKAHGGFLPTIGTALFLLAGEDSAGRLAALAHFAADAPLVGAGLLALDPPPSAEPFTAATLALSEEAVARLLGQEDHISLPAAVQPLTTPLDWSDLSLDPAARQQLAAIGNWLAHRADLRDAWALGPPGYRCLFSGRPGTGKRLAAALLAKANGIDIYRIDLPRLAAQQGDDGANPLATMLDRARRTNAILFFDDIAALPALARADLLARLERWPGLAIFSACVSDPDLAARVDADIIFPLPDGAARLQLWRSAFDRGRLALAPDVDLPALAQAHPLTGGAIVNILRHAALIAIARGAPPQVGHADLLAAIADEERRSAAASG